MLLLFFLLLVVLQPNFPTRKITFLRSTAVMWLLLAWLSPLSPHLIYGIRCCHRGANTNNTSNTATTANFTNFWQTHIHTQTQACNDNGNCRCGLFCHSRPPTHQPTHHPFRKGVLQIGRWLGFWVARAPPHSLVLTMKLAGMP